jgi:hypothetical protein
MDELGKNPRVTEALSKVMDAKGKADTTTRKTLGQVGLAAVDDLDDLRRHVAELERRIAKLEGSTSSSSTSRTRRSSSTTSTKSTSTAKRGSGSASKSSRGPSSS